ncbi:MAG: OsmC family protein [Chloroflexi bacterium]|nr:OsmC family protein [Chloroflexota bacterium]
MNNNLNGLPLPEIRDLIEACRVDPGRAGRTPRVVAQWVGSRRSRIEFRDKTVTHIGGEDELNPMQMLLACLAACDVDLIALHAGLMGIELEALWVEAEGRFNVQAYLGLVDEPGSGYSDIGYTVHLRAPGATAEQLETLRRRCERSSPVGDTLARGVPLRMVFVGDEEN